MVLGTAHGVRAQRNDVLHTGPGKAAKRHAGTNSGCTCWCYSSDITDTTNSPNKENGHEVRNIILTPFVYSVFFPREICHRQISKCFLTCQTFTHNFSSCYRYLLVPRVRFGSRALHPSTLKILGKVEVPFPRVFTLAWMLSLDFSTGSCH